MWIYLAKYLAIHVLNHEWWKGITISKVRFMQISRIPELRRSNATRFLIESHSWNVFTPNWKKFSLEWHIYSFNRQIWRGWYSNIALNWTRDQIWCGCQMQEYVIATCNILICFSEFVARCVSIILIFVGKGRRIA